MVCPLARLLLAVCLTTSTVGPPASAATAPPAPGEAWALATRFDFNAALAALRVAGADEPGAPPAQRLAFAAALLSNQPRTSAAVEQALAITRDVRRATADEPTTRLSAHFLEARILHEHVEPRQPAAAAALYEELLAADSAHPLARRAAVPLALIHLYDAPAEVSAAARVARAEALIPRAADADARRDLHYLIAHTLLAWRRAPDRARDHLLAAAEHGLTYNQANAWVSVGQLAEETGETALAIQAYEAFLALAFRDNRAHTLRQRVADLRTASGAPAATPTP